MTGLMNTADEGDLAGDAHLCGAASGTHTEVDFSAQPDPEAWRSEVAARLARYRTRRKPRAPRYPSLLLPFDSSESRHRPSFTLEPSSIPAPESVDDNLENQQTGVFPDLGSDALASPHFVSPSTLPPEPEPSTNVIEFPRSAAIPVIHASLLADPIFDCPRIVEAPEVLPPPPALGGILIEPAEPFADPRIAADGLIRSASISRRVSAAALDGLIVVSALSAAGAVFVRFNTVDGPLTLVAAFAAAVAVMFWMAYQFLFLVYTGSTPGLCAARLKLTRFDGSPVNRRLRRWRVLASFLSAFAAGLGYIWCFVDRESLCWHDRITRTVLLSSK